MPLKA